jgi:hypothetical protein
MSARIGRLEKVLTRATSSLLYGLIRAGIMDFHLFSVSCLNESTEEEHKKALKEDHPILKQDTQGVKQSQDKLKQA